MKKITIVLTITALGAALLSGPSHAQSLPSSLSAYNQADAAAALSATPSTAEISLLSAVNAQRLADGSKALTWDPRLAAAAQYQELADTAVGFYGEQAVLANWRITVSPAQAAAAFGSPATGVAEGESSSIFNPSDYGDATAMVADWKRIDSGFTTMLSSSAVNACGIGLVAHYDGRSGNTDYFWDIFFGSEGVVAPPPPAPTLNTSGLNSALAAAARSASASADETALLSALNTTRIFDSTGSLTPDAGLTAAAHYQAADDYALGKIALLPKWAYESDGTTGVSPATLASDFSSPATNVQDYACSNNVLSGRFLYMTPDGYLRQIAIWRYADQAGFGSMLTSGVYNSCGIAVVSDGTASQYGVSYPVQYYVLLVGRK